MALSTVKLVNIEIDVLELFHRLWVLGYPNRQQLIKRFL